MLPDTISDAVVSLRSPCLNAPTGAWCSLTWLPHPLDVIFLESQCTYRCVVLPDASPVASEVKRLLVSMHLQVRGAP